MLNRWLKYLDLIRNYIKKLKQRNTNVAIASLSHATYGVPKTKRQRDNQRKYKKAPRKMRIKFKMKKEIYRHVSSKYINDVSVRNESAIRTTNGISAKHISTANGSVKREVSYTWIIHRCQQYHCQSSLHEGHLQCRLLLLSLKTQWLWYMPWTNIRWDPTLHIVLLIPSPNIQSFVHRRCSPVSF